MNDHACGVDDAAQTGTTAPIKIGKQFAKKLPVVVFFFISTQQGLTPGVYGATTGELQRFTGHPFFCPFEARVAEHPLHARQSAQFCLQILTSHNDTPSQGI